MRFRRPEHPLAYGYAETTSVFRAGEPVYAVRRVDEGRFVLQWSTKLPKDDDAPAGDDNKKDKEPPLVVSGGIKGGDELVGKPALLDIEVGKGRVIASGFDPIHRYQTGVGLPPGLERGPQLERPAARAAALTTSRSARSRRRAHRRER